MGRAELIREPLDVGFKFGDSFLFAGGRRRCKFELDRHFRKSQIVFLAQSVKEFEAFGV